MSGHESLTEIYFQESTLCDEIDREKLGKNFESATRYCYAKYRPRGPGQ